MSQPLVLCYNLDFTTDSALQKVCQDQGLRLRAVERREYSMPIGALAGLPVPSTGRQVDNADFHDSMLVMCYMLSEQLDAFLGALRSSNTRPIALKAVLTPTNITWTSWQLRNELAREHEAMKRRPEGR